MRLYTLIFLLMFMIGCPIYAADRSAIQLVVKLSQTGEQLANERSQRIIGDQLLHGFSKPVRLSAFSPLIERELLRLFRKRQPRSDSIVGLQRYYSMTINANYGPELIDHLESQPEIETAYYAPKIAPPPARDIPPQTPKFSQGYLAAAPKGIAAKFANRQPGGAGQNVKVVDIEYGWLRNHEDLGLNKSNLILNNPPVEPISRSYQLHGTAVAGIIVGSRNAYGVQGIAPRADFLMATPFNNEGIYSVASALIAAVNATDEGDIILIEQQYLGPEQECRCSPCDYYVPVEYYLADFEAIKAAVLAGRIVIEAAGNGSQNLDSDIYAGKFLPQATSSLAIMVAAVNSKNRSGICSSNSGTRIDLSAWGDRVVTTGYGDLFDPLRGQRGRKRQQYTKVFSGTSSASAIVAGAAAALQGFAKANNNVLSRNDLLNVMEATGTATADTSNFGVMPDLEAAIEALRP